MKSLKARLLTAVVGISIILVLLFLGEIQPLVIAFAVAAVTAFMTGEYLHANKLLKKYFISRKNSLSFWAFLSKISPFYEKVLTFL